MLAATEIAGDIAGAATALAGLVLVFLGAVAVGYDTYDAEQQHAVVKKFRRRAWFGFFAFLLALLAALCALAGKWFDCNGIAIAGVVLFVAAFVSVVVAAVRAVLDIS